MKDNFNNLFLVGKIVNAFDDGSVEIKPISERNERFLNIDYLFIEIFSVIKKIKVIDSQLHSKRIIVKINSFDTYETSRILIGSSLFVDEKKLEELDDNEYFIHDLIGLEVQYNNEIVGKVIDVIVLPSNSVYVISDNSGSEVLVPAVSDFITAVDIHKRLLVLKQGLDIYDKEV